MADTLLSAAGPDHGVLSLGDPEPSVGVVDAAGAPSVIVADKGSTTSDPLVLDSATEASVAAETPVLEALRLPSSGPGNSVAWSAGQHDAAGQDDSAGHDDESIAPVDGWVSRIEDEDADELKARFRRLSDGEKVEFELEFEHGQPKVKLEDR